MNIKILARLSLFIILAVLSINYFITTTALTKNGEALAVLKREISELKKDNRAIETRLWNRKNLQYIEKEAGNQGLVLGKEIVYLPIPPSSLAVSKR